MTKPEAETDLLLWLGIGLISLACLLWLAFMSFAISGSVGLSLYPASEHALLFMLGSVFASQSWLAHGGFCLPSSPHDPHDPHPTNHDARAPRLSVSYGALFGAYQSAGLIQLMAGVLSALTLATLGHAVIAGQATLLLIVTWWAIAIAFKILLWLALRQPWRSPLSRYTIAALLSGFGGATLMALSHVFVVEAAILAPLAKLLIFDGMPQLALLGLIAVRGVQHEHSSAAGLVFRLLILAGFLASLALEALGWFSWAFALRGIFVALALWQGWRCFLPKAASPLRFWCQLIAASWLGGTLATAIWPQYMIHFKHFIYFGVYLTVTVLLLCAPLRWPPCGAKAVLSRKLFNWVVGLVALGALTRATSYVSHASYVRHLGYAAVILLLAIGLAIPPYLKWRRQKASSQL